MEARIARTIWIVVIATAILAVLILIVAQRVARPIQRSLLSVRDSLRAMADDDLTVPAVIKTRDEVRDTAQALEESRHSMLRIISQACAGLHAAQAGQAGPREGGVERPRDVVGRLTVTDEEESHKPIVPSTPGGRTGWTRPREVVRGRC